MTGEEIDAIVGGYHGDAFRVLGPHPVQEENEEPRWEVRAFLPQAESAAVVTAAGRFEMVKKHTQGLFVATMDGDPADYRIAARLFDGQDIIVDDPYHYGPQIDPADLYLHTEGTLYEAWRIFGAHLTKGGVRFAVWAPNAENVTVAGSFN